MKRLNNLKIAFVRKFHIDFQILIALLNIFFFFIAINVFAQ